MSRLPGASPNEVRDYRITLTEDRDIRTEVEVLNMREEVVGRLYGRVADGQITVNTDTDGAVSVLTASLVDPGNILKVDPRHTGGAALFADRIMKVTVIVSGALIPNGVRVPLFYGPARAMSRDGALVSIEAHDMSVLGLGQAWRTRHWDRGERRTDVLRDILRNVCGYKRVIVPHRQAVLAKDLNLRANQQPWKVAKKLARSMSCQLIARRDGVIEVRPIPQRPAVTFTAAHLVETPKVTPDWTNVRTAVIVRGADPEGAKSGIVERATIDRRHPLSAQRLGLHDAELWLVEEIDDSGIRCVEDAERLARTTMREHARMDVAIELTSLPVYDLEPGDLVAVNVDDLDREFRAHAYTIPLAGGPMTVGYIRKAKPTSRHRRAA